MLHRLRSLNPGSIYFFPSHSSPSADSRSRQNSGNALRSEEEAALSFLILSFFFLPPSYFILSLGLMGNMQKPAQPVFTAGHKFPARCWGEVQDRGSAPYPSASSAFSPRRSNVAPLHHCRRINPPGIIKKHLHRTTDAGTCSRDPRQRERGRRLLFLLLCVGTLGLGVGGGGGDSVLQETLKVESER